MIGKSIAREKVCMEPQLTNKRPSRKRAVSYRTEV